MSIQEYKKQHEAGFTVLLAAIVASLVLALGISVYSIAQKQLILSSTGRNSQYAFYAADTGAECALYWDIRHDFASSSDPISPITCADDPNIVVTVDSQPPQTFLTFQFEPSSGCVNVTVRKQNVHPRTLIRADGFSVACADIELSARTLQRSVELSY